MTPFASLLQEELDRQPEAPAAPGLGAALRAFDGVLDRLSAADAPTALGPAACKEAWAVALGVELPCTVEDLRRAFRKLAFAAHPDRPGGSHDAFLRSQTLLDDALASLRRTHSALIARRYASPQRSSPGAAGSRSTYA